MSVNSFGRLFRYTSWGESHGPAIGVTVDGCPPQVPLEAGMLQHWLERRRPGRSKYTTRRMEDDKVEILSGVFEGRTTGTPIQLMIHNLDQRSGDYDALKDKFRPGHADITYWQKYGIRDHRGSGRASARETASRVAVGGIARAALSVISPDIRICGVMSQMGTHAIDPTRCELGEEERNDFWCPDPVAAAEWADQLARIRKSGDSVGAVIEISATGMLPGLGAPIYGKLDADLAAAMMSINAVKGVEIGAGMAAATLCGSSNADEIRWEDGSPRYLSNNAGGILGGISTGQDIVVRFAVKPTSSILKPQRTIDRNGRETENLDRWPSRPMCRDSGCPGRRSDDGLCAAGSHSSSSWSDRSRRRFTWKVSWHLRT